jgi:hypothetical protein
MKNIGRSRPIFSDGWNSFWHVVFGMLSIRFIIIVPIFVIYQLLDFYDKNLFVDLIEFFIGFFGILFVVFVVFVLNNHKVKHNLVDKTFYTMFLTTYL